jgi:citrate lyase subunit beta/citryl-CoA lyase
MWRAPPALPRHSGPRADRNPFALAQAFEIAAVPGGVPELRADGFVSAHHGAIPGEAMRSPGQFEHPLVRRAMLEISAACHAGKVPSHNVTTDIRTRQRAATTRSARAPNSATCACGASIRARSSPIVAAFRPRHRDRRGQQILLAAHENNWAPIRHDGQLHDRASYRYYWSLLQRAHRHPAPRPSPDAAAFDRHPGRHACAHCSFLRQSGR